MKRIIFFLVGLAITIALVVVVLTIDFSAGANNIYFNTVKEIVENDNPIILKNVMYCLNCMIGFVINALPLDSNAEGVYAAIDNVFYVLNQVIQFFIWLATTIFQKLTIS